MTMPRLRSLADWIDNDAHAASLDADAPLDDLEPLRDLVGSARVVAIGESAHYIPEFHAVRHRILRFLVERMGFTTYALEVPFTAGRAIGRWIEDGDGDIREIASAALPISLGRIPELHDTLVWIREHNLHAEQPLRFVGTDVPGSGGSLVPALERVHVVLRAADPDAVPLVERALELARTHHDDETFAVLARYATVPQSEQDELSAILSRLLARLESMAAHLDTEGGEAQATRLDLRGAWYADHLHRDVAGRGLSAAAASRDAFMAEVVIEQLDRRPDQRIVVASHNVHIQKVPSAESPAGQLPQGFYLAAALDADYRAIAITGREGHTAQIQMNPERPRGFEIQEVPLMPAPDDSLDAHLSGSAPLMLADLRQAPDKAAPRRMRMEGYFLDLPVLEAFDAAAWVPRTSVSAAISGRGSP